MKQKITFVGHLYVDTEGLNWQEATKWAETALLRGDKHAEYSTHLHVVTKIEVDEDE